MAPVMLCSSIRTACVELQRVLRRAPLNDLTGVNTLYASDWSGNAFVDFRSQLGGMELFAGVDVNYRSEFSCQPATTTKMTDS